MTPPFDPATADDSSDAHARFMRLFLGSEKEIFRYVSPLVPRPADAQDVVQQTTIALRKKFEHYDSTQPFTPWACRFAFLEARQFLRRDQRWGKMLDEKLIAVLVERRAELGEDMERRFAHLRTCLQKLPVEQRETVERYYYERQPVERLAGQSGRSIEALYKLLQRVRQALLECVQRAVRAAGDAP